jgi:hypothetical protein
MSPKELQRIADLSALDKKQMDGQRRLFEATPQFQKIAAAHGGLQGAAIAKRLAADDIADAGIREQKKDEAFRDRSIPREMYRMAEEAAYRDNPEYRQAKDKLNDQFNRDQLAINDRGAKVSAKTRKLVGQIGRRNRGGAKPGG